MSHSPLPRCAHCGSLALSDQRRKPADRLGLCDPCRAAIMCGRDLPEKPVARVEAPATVPSRNPTRPHVLPSEMREASRRFMAGAQVWVQTWAGAGSEKHALLLGVTEERGGARGFVLGRGPYAPVVTCENVREILILDKGI